MRPRSTVAFTSCYSHPHDDADVSELERLVTSHGGELVPVYLDCDVDELRRRISKPSRQEMRKLRTVGGLDAFLAAWNCTALSRPNCRTVSTMGRSPAECAAELAEHLGLSNVE